MTGSPSQFASSIVFSFMINQAAVKLKRLVRFPLFTGTKQYHPERDVWGKWLLFVQPFSCSLDMCASWLVLSASGEWRREHQTSPESSSSCQQGLNLIDLFINLPTDYNKKRVRASSWNLLTLFHLQLQAPSTPSTIYDHKQKMSRNFRVLLLFYSALFYPWPEELQDEGAATDHKLALSRAWCFLLILIWYMGVRRVGA